MDLEPPIPAVVDIDLTVAEHPRVLVVDDNSSILEVVEILLTLEFSDLDLRTVKSGEEALQQVDWSPAVVVVDWQMPGLSGLETIRLLRPDLPGAKLIMYSSLLAADAQEQALAAGADCYLEKGADTERLLDEVALGLGRARTSGRAATT